MMKGRMLQRLIKKILLASVFLFSSCDLNSLFNPAWDDPVNEFLKEYTETAGIMAMELDGSYPVNSEGITCLPCTGDRKIKFYLRNPQNYTLNVSMETEDSVNTDVTVKQDENDKSLITLLYPKDYLLNKDKDTADKNISGVIKIVEPKSGRSFADYSVSLHANSLPPSIENAVFQLDSADINNANYVICFYFPELSTIENGIHQDVNVLLVNGNKKYVKGTTVYSDEECESVDTAFTTDKPEGLTYLEDSGGYQFAPDSAPDDYIPLYYKTNIKPSTDEIRYSFILQDKEGLKGNETGISNKARQLKEPSIEVEADKSYAVDEDTGFYTLLISHDGLCEDGTSVGTVTINYTVKGGSSAEITGSSEGSVSIKLPKGTYEVSATAVKKFFITSDKSSVTNVKITRSPVFYVSEKGNDSENTGSKLSPYRTIQKAVDAFREGIDSADYESSAECKIYVMTDLTPPEDFNFSSNSNSFISIPNDVNNISILGYDGIRTVKAGRSSENEGRVLSSLCSGSLTLSNINLTGGYTSENGGGIYNKGSLILSGVTVSGNKAEVGAGVYCESASSLKITGKNTIYDNMIFDGTKQSNIYLPVRHKINIDGDISGSKIGVNVPWQSDDEDAPRIGVPAEFTSGYGTYNTALPGEIFITENNYSITASSSGEAAFAVSGGGMYTALDYTVNLTASSVKAALNKAKSVTVAVSGTRKEPSGATTALYYNNEDNKFYIDEEKAAGDNKVTFAAALYNGATKVSDCAVAAASETGKILVTVPAIAFEDTYTIRVTSTFLGVTKDVNVEYVVRYAYTPDGAISAIQGMSGGSLYVAVAGTITSSQLSQIKDAINAAYSNYDTTRISLDLSGCTGLSGYFLSFNGCKGLSEIILPEGITSLGAQCFRDCLNLTDVYLPASLSSMEDSAFLYCSAGLTVSKDSLYYMREGDALYSKDGKTLVMYCNKLEENSAFTVPARVEEIGAWAFGQAKIKTISFESNSIMKTVGQHAFDRCKQLISIEFPDSIETIGQMCFQYNDALENVKLPASLTVVPQSMFGYSAAFTSIVIPDGVTQIQYAAFWGIDTLQTIVLPASLQTVVYGAFNYCSGLTTVNYKGSEEQKAVMTIETNQNTKLINATWNYNYTD